MRGGPTASILFQVFKGWTITALVALWIYALKAIRGIIEKGIAQSTSPVKDVVSSQKTIAQLLRDPSRFLRYGMFLVAYLGLLFLIFGVWRLNESSASTIWQGFFGNAVVVSGVFFLLIAKYIVDWIRAGHSPYTTISPEAGTSWIRTSLDFVKDPRLAVMTAAIPAVSLSAIYFLILVWSDRNDSPVDFWRVVCREGFKVAVIAGFLLVFRAFVVRFGRVGIPGLREATHRTHSGSWLDDPDRLLRILTYVLTYTGLISLALTMWIFRGQATYRVWYSFFNHLATTVFPVVVCLGLRSLYGQLPYQAKEPTPPTSA
jgi:hypothetical protein